MILELLGLKNKIEITYDQEEIIRNAERQAYLDQAVILVKTKSS